MSTKLLTLLSSRENRKLLFPVLHVIRRGEDDEKIASHVVSQALLAKENGADGLCLCPADAISPPMMESVARAVRAAWPEVYMVVNYLHDTAESMGRITECDATDALWTDRGVDARGVHPDVIDAAMRRKKTWGGDWHMGYFHKGSQRTLPERDSTLEGLGAAAAALAQVLVTTGAGTGVAADVEFLKRVHASVKGARLLAIASGVDSENVSTFLPFIDIFFVASGIEEDTGDHAEIEFFKSAGLKRAVRVGYLDPERVKALADIIHGFVGVGGAGASGSSAASTASSSASNSSAVSAVQNS